MVEGIEVPSVVRRYQQRCFQNYAKYVGRPQSYKYPDGNLIRPVPPVQAIQGSVMIVGAYRIR